MSSTTATQGKVPGSVVVLDGPVLDSRLPHHGESEFRAVLPPVSAGQGLNVAFAAAKVGGPVSIITGLDRANGADVRFAGRHGAGPRSAHAAAVGAFEVSSSNGFLQWSAATPVAVGVGPIEGRQEIQLSDTLVITLNSSIDTIREAILAAREAGTSVWLYASPNRYSSTELRKIPWAGIDGVVANEDAARQLARASFARGPLVQQLKGLAPQIKLACVVNGAEGSHTALSDGIAYASPSTPRAIEGARLDAFTGTLVSNLASDKPLTIDDARLRLQAASIAGGCNVEGRDVDLRTVSVASYAPSTVRVVHNGPDIAPVQQTARVTETALGIG